MFARLLAISMLTLLALAPAPSTAQLAKTLLPGDAAEAPALSDPMTMEEVRELVARLSDKEVRDLLLERLDAVADAEDDAPGAPLLDLLEDSATGVYGTFLSISANQIFLFVVFGSLLSVIKITDFLYEMLDSIAFAVFNNKLRCENLKRWLHR